MPRKRAVPSYCHHKATGQAVCRVKGRDFYLGVHGTPGSIEAYQRLVAEIAAAGSHSKAIESPTNRITIVELLLRYREHVASWYVKDGRPTSEQAVIKLAIRPLRELYGQLPAEEFGPIALMAVRQRMIDAGWKRPSINIHVSRIRQIFKWAAAQEILPVTIYQALKTVPGLRAGRTDAVESKPVKPVPEAFVDAVNPFVSRQVWAMIELQRLTGMRPGEVCSMRTCDVNTQGNVWEYQPASHKTQHHGHAKVIFLGPRAQAVLKTWLKADLQAFLFSPAEALLEQIARRRENRKSPMTPSHQARKRKAKPKRTPGDQYDANAYRVAIQRACKRAAVPQWHPHQLRHNAATWLRREFGLEIARVILGHRSAAITEVYAELDKDKARDVMAKIG